MPPILTCLVHRRLCHNPSEDHWSLREYSANLVAIICNRFGNAYPTLQPRITKTLLSAFLDPNKPLTTHYGAIKGLASLGHHVVRILLLPHVKEYLRLLEPEMVNSSNISKRLEATKCYGALLEAIGDFVRQEFQLSLTLHSAPMGSLTAGSTGSKDDEEGEEDGSEKETEEGKQTMMKKKNKKRKRVVSGRSTKATIPDLDAPIQIQELFDLFGESLYPYAQLGMDRYISPMDQPEEKPTDHTTTTTTPTLGTPSLINKDLDSQSPIDPGMSKSARKNALYLRKLTALRRRMEQASREVQPPRSRGQVSYYDLPYICV